MGAELTLEIITPAKIVFNGTINSVTIPGTEGSFQVLKNHAPLISTFEVGLIKADINPTQTIFFATTGGTVEVKDNKVLILADALEKLEEIDTERAKQARERAQLMLANPNKTTDVERARRALARSTNRLNLVEKYIRGLK
jgi:F-type H+-transporting ATPase subunit epsilon